MLFPLLILFSASGHAPALPVIHGDSPVCAQLQSLICPIMDARRKQVYTGIYRYEDHRLVTVKDQMAVGIEELLSMLNEMGETVTFLGDGVPVFKDIIADKLEVPFSFAPSHLSRQRAGAVGALGILYYKEGRSAHLHHRDCMPALPRWDSLPVVCQEQVPVPWLWQSRYEVR